MWTSEYFSEIRTDKVLFIYRYTLHIPLKNFYVCTYIDLINVETLIHDPHMYDKYVKS